MPDIEKQTFDKGVKVGDVQIPDVVVEQLESLAAITGDTRSIAEIAAESLTVEPQLTEAAKARAAEVRQATAVRVLNCSDVQLLAVKAVLESTDNRLGEVDLPGQLKQ